MPRMTLCMSNQNCTPDLNFAERLRMRDTHFEYVDPIGSLRGSCVNGYEISDTNPRPSSAGLRFGLSKRGIDSPADANDHSKRQ